MNILDNLRRSPTRKLTDRSGPEVTLKCKTALNRPAPVRCSDLVRRMEKPFFVMLNNQKGTRLVPLADPENELMMYATKEEAEDAARHTFYGENFGFEVHEAGGAGCCV